MSQMHMTAWPLDTQRGLHGGSATPALPQKGWKKVSSPSTTVLQHPGEQALSFRAPLLTSPSDESPEEWK